MTGDVDPNPPVANQPITIGLNGIGSLLIDNGSELTTLTSSIGVSGVGSATVTGPGSRWTVNAALAVGTFNGVGSLSVTNGGVIEAVDLQVGVQDNTVATAEIVGPGSVISLGSALFVGQNGSTADLTVGGGGVLDGDTLSISLIGPNGILNLEDGIVRINRLENQGVLSGSGSLTIVNSNTGILNTGDISVAPGDRLRIGAGIDNPGSLTLSGGEIEADGLQNFGLVTLEEGVLNINATTDLLNSGTLLSIGGANDVIGNVQASSSDSILSATNDSVLRFHNNVNSVGGTISVFSGSRAVFLGDLDVTGGTLLAEISGSGQTNDFGRAEIVGELIGANTTLSISAGIGFDPRAGDSFTLLTASGGVVGEPTLGDLPELPPGLAFELTTTANALIVDVIVDGLPGDANLDGFVNAADFTVIRDLGGAGLGAGLADFQSNFGGGSGPDGVAQLITVPEPGTAALLALIGVGAAFPRMRGRG